MNCTHAANCQVCVICVVCVFLFGELIYLVNKEIRKKGGKTILWGCSVEPESIKKQMLEDYPSPNSNTNFFYGSVSRVQIQQGTVNSTQNQTIPAPLDESKIVELINSIRKYDSVLDDEYGKENANELRNAVTELESTRNKPNSEGKKRGLIAYIRDLSVNASGGLIAAGILQLISNILG